MPTGPGDALAIIVFWVVAVLAFHILFGDPK